jgi:hypothetical protein
LQPRSARFDYFNNERDIPQRLLWRTFAAPGYRTLDRSTASSDNAGIGAVEMHVAHGDMSVVNSAQAGLAGKTSCSIHFSYDRMIPGRA